MGAEGGFRAYKNSRVIFSRMILVGGESVRTLLKLAWVSEVFSKENSFSVTGAIAVYERTSC